MYYPGFIGPSSPSQSAIANSERTINWYVERSQAQATPSGAALFPIPGQSLAYQTTDVGTRAFWSEKGRAFAVVGGGWWETLADGTKTRRNGGVELAQDNNPATVAFNSNVGTIGITSGGNFYHYVLATNVLTKIGTLDGKATMCGYKDGYYLVFNALNNTCYLSALNDGTSFTIGLNFFQPSIASDPRLMMIVSNPAVYFIGEQTSEAWFNEGVNTNQPFVPILSSFMNYGTVGSFAGGRAGDTVYWLTRTKQGVGNEIVATKGFDPHPISNYAVSTALGRYKRDSTLDDAEMPSYEEDGHLFIGLQLWQARASWWVDLGTGDWHERGTWNPARNSYDAWHPRIFGSAFGKNFTGERATGIISESNVTYASEADGSPIRRLRIGPPIWASNNRRVQISRLEMQFDVGLGLSSGQGSIPQVMLRESLDGHTWGSERSHSAGGIGQYRTRVVFTRCGSSDKLWMPEVTVSDPIPWRVSAAEIFGSNLGQIGRAA